MAANRTDDAGFSMFGPDFPFAYDDWLKHRDGLGSIPAAAHDKQVAIVGGGIAGLVCAFELMKVGLRPVVYEAGQLGGRLRSHVFEGTDGPIAELGAMRFPRSSRAFHHYVNMLGLKTRPFPNPLTPAARSTVVDLEGQSFYAQSMADLPPIFQEVAAAYLSALDEGASFKMLQQAIARRDAEAVRSYWSKLVPLWDERTFYDFVTTSRAFSSLSFRHREIFGQVGFGTGGWDSDFPNSMLEILRVHATACDEEQYLIVSGAEQVAQKLWRHRVPHGGPASSRWRKNVSLHDLHGGAPRPGVKRMGRHASGAIEITDRWGTSALFGAAVVACQSWLLTTGIDCEEQLFSQKLWMALDRTRYMQSSKTFVLVDRPFWRDVDPNTGRHPMSMTLTDRITRGTYLFDYGKSKPGVICLTYTWMADALKMLPLPIERRVELCLAALAKIYPDVDIASHIRGDPVTVSWESDPNFLGAFKGALPGHYRYNRRMYCHFMQDKLPAAERGVFLAGDDVSWTPGWVEGAVQTALNAVWGVIRHFDGTAPTSNPGPGDVFDRLAPIALPD